MPDFFESEALFTPHLCLRPQSSVHLPDQRQMRVHHDADDYSFSAVLCPAHYPRPNLPIPTSTGLFLLLEHARQRSGHVGCTLPRGVLLTHVFGYPGNHACFKHANPLLMVLLECPTVNAHILLRRTNQRRGGRVV